MISIAAFSEIVSLIYAAVVSPESWDDALVHIHNAFAVTGVSAGQVRSTALVVADDFSRSKTGTFSSDVDRSYSEHYDRLDFVLDAVERGPVGVLRTGTELIAPRTRTEFYTDFLRPNGFCDGLLVRLTSDDKPTSFLIAGSQGDEPFDTQERRELLTLLVPHLQRALRTQGGMSSIKRRTGELAEALDSVEQGIVIVTDDLRLVHGNVAAGRILREGDALASQAGRLTTTMPAVRARLEALLYLALHGDGLGARPGGSLACERRSGRRPYAVHVLPLTAQQTEFASHGPAAMVVIVDPERRPRPATETLRVLFGLTKTEAAVAQLVMNGEGLGPIGEQLSLSNDTVKTHLRNVFHKTDTHRQAELVRLLVAITV